MLNGDKTRDSAVRALSGKEAVACSKTASRRGPENIGVEAD